jgi:Immunity protein 31
MAEGHFDWYERVRVATPDSAKAAIDGKLGAVVGKAQADDGRWSYGVFVYEEQVVWSCWEDELICTGEFDRRESHYGGESIRVSPRGELLG